MEEEKVDYKEKLNSGKYIFKFFRFDINALQILANDTLYFSSSNKLNDPLDSRFKLKVINPNNFSKKQKTILEIQVGF